MPVTVSPSELHQRTERLYAIRDTLKKEFVGIDRVIDEVTESMMPWYALHETQRRPLIINLWGMTGTGKTSLVKRISELLGMEQRYHRLDMNRSHRNFSMASDLINTLRAVQGSPVILLLDEFQHAGTANMDSNIMNPDISNLTWNLLDSGFVEEFDLPRTAEEFRYNTERLRHALHLGVKVEAGVVVEGQEVFRGLEFSMMRTLIKPRFRKEPQQGQEEEEQPLVFFDDSIQTFIHRAFFPRFLTLKDLWCELQTMDGHAAMRLADEALERAASTKLLDCTKALVFVAGNLDNLYTMSGELNPDIPADTFHAMSLRITLPQVKGVLSKHFRLEHLARLGNNHIIYPAFSSADYRRLIGMELERVRKEFHESFGIALEMGRDVEVAVYGEGVFPTQGTRPVFSTVDRLLRSQFPMVGYRALTCGRIADKVRIVVRRKALVAELLHGGQVEGTHTLTSNLTLTRRRARQNDDVQAMVAVHESGHAVVSVMLKGLLPTCVRSVSVGGEMGFTLVADSDDRLMSFDDMALEAACLLAGQAAEELIFGKGLVTCGSQSDLARATSLVHGMLTREGLGPHKAIVVAANNQRKGEVIDHAGEMDRLVSETLARAYQQALQLLRKERRLLLEMAAALVRTPKLGQTAIRRLVHQFATCPPPQKDRRRYRDILAVRLGEARVGTVRAERTRATIETA